MEGEKATRNAQRLAQAMQDWCDNEVILAAQEASDGPDDATIQQCMDDRPLTVALLSEAFRVATGCKLLLTTDAAGQESFVVEWAK